jgi:hypothetical protein
MYKYVKIDIESGQQSLYKYFVLIDLCIKYIDIYNMYKSV